MDKGKIFSFIVDGVRGIMGMREREKKIKTWFSSILENWSREAMCKNLQRSHRHSGQTKFLTVYSGDMGNRLSLNRKDGQLSLNLSVNLLNCKSQLLISLPGISFFLLINISTCTSKVSDQKFPWVWFWIVVYPHPEEKQTVSTYVPSVTSHPSNISIYTLEIDFFKKRRRKSCKSIEHILNQEP